MLPEQTLSYWLTLSFVQNLGVQTVRYLLKRFRSLEGIFSASHRALSASGLQEIQINAIKNPDHTHVDRALSWKNASATHHIIDFTSPNYPDQLREIAQPPLLLYVAGDIALLKQPQLAIVGTRNPTHQGQELATRFALAVSQAGLKVTSGLAIGIDGICHQTAIAAGYDTIAVLGSGLCSIYPKRHEQLAKRIIKKGALVSEHPLDTPPKKQNFPRRNRIINGLSLGVLVIEAARKSGSLITAKMAVDEGREVFALPGSLQNPLSTGCHWLIQQGAKLVTHIDDILMEISEIANTKSQNHSSEKSSIMVKKQQFSLDYHEKQVLACIDQEVTTIDQICERSKLSAQIVLSALIALELSGHIKPTAGGYFLEVNA